MPLNKLSFPLAWWQQNFNNFAPAGYVLRKGMAKNWCRFHSLPESKRYPENAHELGEVLHRHKAVADTLFQQGESVFIYRCRPFFSDCRKPKPGRLSGASLSRDSMIISGETLGSEPDEMFMVWARVDTWRPRYFGKVIGKISRDRESLITLVSPASKRMFCPYDGGMDIFAEDALVKNLSATYIRWKSGRSDYL